MLFLEATGVIVGPVGSQSCALTVNARVQPTGTQVYYGLIAWNSYVFYQRVAHQRLVADVTSDYTTITTGPLDGETRVSHVSALVQRDTAASGYALSLAVPCNPMTTVRDSTELP
jgi:hypothetical protein